MLNEKLNNKLLSELESFTNKLESLKNEQENLANQNIAKIKDKKMQNFLSDSLKAASKGEITIEEFTNQFKDLNNAD